MSKKQWKRQVFPMFKDLQWEVKAGFKSFVADQGAARFDVPRAWIVEPGDTSVKFFDRAQPDARCALEATVFRLPPGIDWLGLPLAKQLAEATREVAQQELWRSDISRTQRGALEIVQLASRYLDEEEHREALARRLLARRLPVQIFISFAFWPEDAARLVPVWEEVVRSLRLAEYVAPPFQADRN